jgi:hypothetical protein
MAITAYTATEALHEAARTGTISEPLRTWKSGAVLVAAEIPRTGTWKVRCMPADIEAARAAAKQA